MKINRKFINWKATGYKLFTLRNENTALRRYVCSMLRKESGKCSRIGDCASCDVVDMDRNISRAELAEIFGVGEASIANWESARSLFYCQIAEVELKDILVFFD